MKYIAKISYSSKSNEQNKKIANWWFLFNVVLLVVTSVIGYLNVRFTIQYFGETTNGVTRIITQILSYANSLNGGFFIIFSIKIINAYKMGERERIFYYARLITKIARNLGLGFLVITFAMAGLIAFFFDDSRMSFNFVFLLVTALSLPIVFSLLFLSKNTTLLNATNNGHLVAMINSIIKVLVYAVFYYAILLRPPQLEFVEQGNDRVLQFTSANIGKAFNLVIGFFIVSLEPIIEGIIFAYMVRNSSKDISKFVPRKNEWAIIKREIWSGLVQALALNLTFLVLYNTDEFAFMMLRNQKSSQIILQVITIYGIYVSTLTSIRSLVVTYIESFKVVIGENNTRNLEHQKNMQLIKTNSHLFGAIFFVFSIFIVPILIKILFEPKGGVSYANVQFSIPIAILCWTIIINDATKLEFELSNKLKNVAYIFVIEAIVNLVLSFALVRTLGIYWVIWASVIASFIKVALFEFLVFKNRKNYKSQFYLTNSWKTYLTIALLLVGLFEIAIAYVFDINKVIADLASQFDYLFVGIIIFMYGVFILLFVIFFRGDLLSNQIRKFQDLTKKS